MCNTIKPKVKEYAMTVVIPMTRPVCDCEGAVENAEKIFISLRDYAARTHRQRVECDCARIIIKYARTHGAERCEFKSVEENLEITLHFDDADCMMKFKEGLAQAVENAILK